jgi:hypothetical protein
MYKNNSDLCTFWKNQIIMWIIIFIINKYYICMYIYTINTSAQHSRSWNQYFLFCLWKFSILKAIMNFSYIYLFPSVYCEGPITFCKVWKYRNPSKLKSITIWNKRWGKKFSGYKILKIISGLKVYFLNTVNFRCMKSEHSQLVSETISHNHPYPHTCQNKYTATHITGLHVNNKILTWKTKISNSTKQ